MSTKNTSTPSIRQKTRARRVSRLVVYNLRPRPHQRQFPEACVVASGLTCFTTVLREEKRKRRRKVLLSSSLLFSFSSVKYEE